MFTKQFLFIVTISLAAGTSTFIDKLTKNVDRYKQSNFQWNVRNFDDDSVSLRKLEDEKDKLFDEYLEHLGSVSHDSTLDVVKSLRVNNHIQQRNTAARLAHTKRQPSQQQRSQLNTMMYASELNIPQVMCSECDDRIDVQAEDAPQSMMYGNKQPRNVMMYNAKEGIPQTMLYSDKVNTVEQPRNVMMYNAIKDTPRNVMMYNAIKDTPRNVMMYNAIKDTPRNVMMYNAIKDTPRNVMMYNAIKDTPRNVMMYNAIKDTPRNVLMYNAIKDTPRNVMMYNAIKDTPRNVMMYNAIKDTPRNVMMYNAIKDTPRNVMMYNAIKDTPRNVMMYNAIRDTPRNVMMYNAIKDTPRNVMMYNAIKDTPRNVMMYNAIKDTPRNVMMYNAIKDTPRNVMMYNAIKDTPRNVMMYNAIKDTPRNVMMYNAIKDTPRNVMMYNAIKDTPRNVMMYNAIKDTPRNVMMYNAIKDTPRNVMMYNAIKDTPRNVMIYDAIKDTPRNVMMYNAIKDTPRNVMMYNAIKDTPRNVMMYNAIKDTPRNVMMYNAKDTPQTMMYNAKEDIPQTMMYNASEEEFINLPNVMLSVERLSQPLNPLSMKYSNGITDIDQPVNVMMYNAIENIPQTMLYNGQKDIPVGRRNVMMYNAKDMPQTMMYNAKDTPQTMMYNAKEDIPQTMMYNANEDTPQTMTYNALEEEFMNLPNVMLSVERLSQPLNPLSMKYSNGITDIDQPVNVMMYNNAIENIPQTMLYNGQKDIPVGRRNNIPTQKHSKVQTASNDRRIWYKTVATLAKSVPNDDVDYFNKWSETIALFGTNLTARAQFRNTFPAQTLDEVMNNLASVTVFEKLFWPFVLENGFMNQKLGLLGLSGVSTYAQDQKLAFYEALEQYQKIRIPVSSDKLVISFNEEVVVDGLNRSGLMETTKQYVESGLHLYTPEEELIISERVNDALYLINDTMPELYETISQVMACFAYYKAQNPGFAGGSISSALGLTWQDPRVFNEQSVAHYAEQIVHEFIHNSLFLADMVHGTFVNAKLTSQAKVYSPIRHKLRDFDKTFHASYVATGVTLFYARAGNYEKAKKLLEPLKTSVAGLVEINNQVGVLNESGNAMLQSMVDFLTVIRFI